MDNPIANFGFNICISVICLGVSYDKLCVLCINCCASCIHLIDIYQKIYILTICVFGIHYAIYINVNGSEV